MNVITVAAAIILNQHKQLLLVRKRNTQFFMQVGGKLEPNEAPEQTMIREIAEEISANAEIAEMKWIDLDDEQTLLAPLTKEVVIPWCKQYLASTKNSF